MSRTIPSRCVLAVLLLATGCAPAVKLVPVSGKVMLERSPLKAGSLSFTPDADKGNTAAVNPTGTIAADGSYTVTTDGKPGAPIGWYRVTVRTQTPAMSQQTTKPVRIDSRFADSKRTPLSINVVEMSEPGAYDLTVTK